MKIKVKIHACERLHYSRTVEMEQEEFKKWERKLAAGGQKERDAEEQIVDRYLDRRDPSDFGDLEVDTFEEVQ